MEGEKHTDIYYKLGEMHGDIKSTLAEAKRTNGRVTNLESVKIPEITKRIDNIEIKIAKYIGMATVIIFLLNVLLPRIIDKFL